MEFQILGPIDVRGEDGAVALGGNKPRAVLAVLLLHANEPVSAERLALALWGEDAPGSAVKTVQVHVSRLRKALGDPDIVATTAAGYRLRVRPDELDSQRFERLVEDGRRALASGQPEHASAVLRGALSLWRGPPLAELAAEPFAAAEIARLEEQRLAALEARVEADLAAGRHDQLVGELQQLVADNPIRERLAGQLMLALYRCGRQSEALEAYGQARRTLVSEVGVEPGPELRRLQDAILRQDVSLEPRAPVADLPAELDAATAPPLVGRDGELAWLQKRWERAQAGAGTLVSVIGEPGIGKTRLAAELAGECSRLGATVLYVTGSARVEVLLAALDRTAEATLPTLLVVDDTDRAGDEALARVEELASTLARMPVLVLATGVAAEPLAGLGSHHALMLRPLDEQAVGRIAAGYAPGLADDDVPAQWLQQASGGVPRHVHEVAGQWARREAARRVGAVAGRAAAGRAELRSIESELTGDLVELQAARERILPAGDDDAPVVCPFKGLASFDVADAQYFFGRERLVAELVARLVGAPLLAVVGPSGSGKSSVMRAGLLPALASGVLPGSDGWAQVLIRPGEHPARELRDMTAGIDGNQHVVIAVDQFEETFTTCRDEEERAAFIAELVSAAGDRHQRSVVVIALRADFYGRCAAYPGLSELVASNHVLVGSMRRDELRRAVERPAQRVGLLVDPELADALVADVKDEPGALPLLSTALLELWQRRDGRRLRYVAYEQTGGVRGAVARLAEDAFGQLDEQQQKVARSVLMRLAGEGAAGAVERRRVALAELETERNEEVARVVALLTDRRLLTVSEGTIEFAHEALLREWPRLRGWIDEDRDGLRIQRSLSAGAHEWERLGRDEGSLYRGSRLAEVREWNTSRKPPLNALEREFLEASDARRERERAQRRRRLVLAFSGLVTVLVAISIVAIVSVSQSREAKRQRDVAASRAIAARSADFVATDPRLSLALAREAIERRETEAAQNALRQATLADRTRALWSVTREGPANGIAVSRDRELLASAGEDGTVRIRNVDGGRVVATITDDAPALAASFSPDGRRIAIASLDGEVALTDVPAGRRRVVLRRSGGDYVRSVDFRRDGPSLLIGTSAGAVGILPLRGKRRLRLLPDSGEERVTARYSNDGTRIVAASDDGAARIWSAAGGAPSTLQHRAPVQAAAFSPDGELVATAGADGVMRIWDADRPGSPEREITVDKEALGSVRFSANGRRLVTVGLDGAVRVVDVRGGPPLAEMRGHFGPAIDAVFVRGIDDVASVGQDGTLRRWTVSPLAVLPQKTPSGRPNFSPDGKRVVSGYADGGVRIWNPATGATTDLPAHAEASQAAYSADGSHIVSASQDGAVSLWNTKRRQSRRVSSFAGEKFGVAIDRTGSRIAISTLDQPTVIQRPGGGGRVVLRGHEGLVVALAFSPDGRHVVSASDDATARIWNAATGRQERSLPHSEAVVDASYSRDGRFVATAASDGTVRIWPVTGGRPVLHYGHVGQANTVAFDPDGERVVSAGTDGTVRVWNAAGGETLVTLHTHGENALGASFNPDGTRVVSAGEDGTLRITMCAVCGSLADVLKLAESLPERALTGAERQRLLTGEG